MITFKAKGLVLREYEAGESDKRLLILLKGHGRKFVYARGARKPNSKFLAASGLFTYGDFVLADGKQFLSLAQAEVIENFYSIRQDYDMFCWACRIIKVCEKAVPEATPCDDLLRLALKALQHISTSQQDIPTIVAEQAVAVFLFRFFLISGIAPEMEVCSACGESLDAANTFGSIDISSSTDSSFIFCHEGLLCISCRGKAPERASSRAFMKLSPAVKAAIKHILSSELNQAFLFRCNKLGELMRAANLCYSYLE